MKEKTIRINISMSEDFHQKLKKYAAQNERSLSAQIRYSLEQEMRAALEARQC